MPILRLAYATQFLIALVAVFVLWSEVGGQVHLDLMPWYLKLGLGAGAAFAAVKATSAAVSREYAWNSRTPPCPRRHGRGARLARLCLRPTRECSPRRRGGAELGAEKRLFRTIFSVASASQR